MVNPRYGPSDAEQRAFPEGSVLLYLFATEFKTFSKASLVMARLTSVYCHVRQPADLFQASNNLATSNNRSNIA